MKNEEKKKDEIKIYTWKQIIIVFSIFAYF